MKKGRADLDLTFKHSEATELTMHGTVQQFTNCSDSELFSVIFPFNDAFSHSFSIGVSHAVYILYFMSLSNTSRVLIPSGGPFLSLLEALEVPRNRIVVAGDKNSLYYSQQATLLFRKPPFNLLQAHWPAHALSDMRNITVEWLIQNGHVRITDNTTKSVVRDQVVYLWREGERSVADQIALGAPLVTLFVAN